MMETTVVAPLKSVGQAPSVDTPLLISLDSAAEAPAESIESTDPAPVETVVNTPSTVSAQSLRDEKAEYQRQMLEMQRQMEMMREMLRKFNAVGGFNALNDLPGQA